MGKKIETAFSIGDKVGFLNPIHKELMFGDIEEVLVYNQKGSVTTHYSIRVSESGRLCEEVLERAIFPIGSQTLIEYQKLIDRSEQAQKAVIEFINKYSKGKTGGR